MYISDLDQLFPTECVNLKTFLKESKFYKFEETETKKPKQKKKKHSDPYRL